MSERANEATLVPQRSTPVTNSCIPAGYSPLNATTNWAMNATTHCAMPRKTRTMTCGIRAMSLMSRMVSTAQPRELRGG